MMKIGLDAGHGLFTKGKQTPTNIKEWTLNDKVRDKIITILSDYDCEIVNTDNNEGNVDESLSTRLNKYVNAGVKVFVSIHHNAFKGIWGKATGVEVFTNKKPSAESTALANLVYGKLVSYTGLRGRGVKKENWAVINQNKITAILVEGGFMDSTIDYPVITSDVGQAAYAKAVAEALIEYYKIPKKIKPVPVKPVEQPKPTSTKIDVTYQVWDNVRNAWLPNVKNDSDYAGIMGHDICCVYANLSKGNITYKVHTKDGRWLPEVKNRTDYAGLYNKPIDALMVKTDTGKSIKYRVHLRHKNRWLPWVTGCNEKDNNNGYAGILGQEIDGIQIKF